MMYLDMDDLPNIDESPATIGYALLVMLAAHYDMAYESTTDVVGNEMVSVTNREGDEIIQLMVSPVMADLMVSVIEGMAEEIIEEIHTWGSRN